MIQIDIDDIGKGDDVIFVRTFVMFTDRFNNEKRYKVDTSELVGRVVTSSISDLGTKVFEIRFHDTSTLPSEIKQYREWCIPQNYLEKI